MASNEIITSDDSYDTLSFCDLPMDSQATDLDTFFECDTDEDEHHNDGEVFEFLTSPECEPSQSIMFCGKSIVDQAPKQQPKKGLLARKDSFKKSRSSRSDPSSGSFRFGGPPKVASPASCYRSSSGGSKKQPRVMIGLVRVEPTMELSDIRKRQRRRRSPVPMFAGGGQSRKPESGSSGHNNWGLFRPLRCRVQFVTALTKASFCCISHA